MAVKIFCAAASALVTFAATSFVHAADSSDAGGELETIVVTASPLAHDRHFLATIVDSVDRSEILQSGGGNLADALANQPGVTGTSFAAGASRPIIRGFDANRVRVLENGIGSFDVSDVGPDHGVPIDPLSTQRIEIVRGAATLRYGSQAIGGVVNAINNRVPDSLPDKPVIAELTGTYATGADTRQESAQIDAAAGQFAIHADAFDRNAGDYDIPHGVQSNSYFEGDGYALGGSYFFGSDRIGLGAVHYDAKYGIPGEDTFIDMKQTKEMFRSSFAGGGDLFNHATVEAGHADYEHSELDPATGEALSTFKDNEWDARFESVFGATGPFSGSALGAQLQNRDFSALGEGADYLQPTTTRSSAVFAFGEVPLGAKSLNLQTGARAERVEVDGIPASDVPTRRTFTPISASLGVAFDANARIRLGATLTSAARAPAQTELFARGPHDGPGTFETGDPTLGPERANSLEGTLRYNRERVGLEGSLWIAKFSDYIFGALTGRTCDDDGNCVADDSQELKELNYTQVDATFKGAEGKASFPLGDDRKGQLRFDLLADYVRATIDQGGNVPRIPPYHVGAGLHWDTDRLDAGFMLRYAGKQTDVGAAETPTPGFTSVDAHFGWRPMRTQPTFELAVVGRNLTDTDQRNATALNKDEVLMPGRDLRLVARMTF